jgi:hypothetical protein
VQAGKDSAKLACDLTLVSLRPRFYLHAVLWHGQPWFEGEGLHNVSCVVMQLVHLNPGTQPVQGKPAC